MWRSRCLPEPDADDPYWSCDRGPGYYVRSEKKEAVYPGVYEEGGRAPSGKQGIFFDQAHQPHILHLHGPGIDETELGEGLGSE